MNKHEWEENGCSEDGCRKVAHPPTQTRNPFPLSDHKLNEPRVNKKKYKRNIRYLHRRYPSHSLKSILVVKKAGSILQIVLIFGSVFQPKKSIYYIFVSVCLNCALLETWYTYKGCSPVYKKIIDPVSFRTTTT